LVTGLGAAEEPRPLVRLLPVDEANSDPALVDTRNRLLAALGRGDHGTVIAAIIPSVRRSHLYLTNSEVAELTLILRLGGSFTTDHGAQPGRREFCAPYVYSAWRMDQIPVELLEGGGEGPPMAVIAKDVAVRIRPSASAPIMARVSYEIVGVPGEAYPSDGRAVEWQAIILRDHRKGFVPPSVLRDPDDVHVCFADFDGQWMITVFSR
jgi:hypothetical protein